MLAMTRLGRRKQPGKGWCGEFLDNLRCGLTGWEILIGLAAAVFVTLLLIGFRYPSIPDYREGEIATQEVRASQDVRYEDIAATQRKREDTLASVPAVYVLDTALIFARKNEISRSFAAARDLLSDRKLPANEAFSSAQERSILAALADQTGDALPPAILPIFLRQRFNPIFEGQILKVLDAVLREGIISDRAQFLKDQRTGVIVRDSSTQLEHALNDSFPARDLAAASDYLHQFRLEFSALTQTERTVLLQFLESKLEPTLLYDANETNTRRAQAVLRVKPVEIQIGQGRTLIRIGEEVTENILSQLQALRNLQRRHSLAWQFAGYLFFVTLFLYAVWRYLTLHQERRGKIQNYSLLVLMVLGSQLALIRLATLLIDLLAERLPGFQNPSLLYYAFPFAFGAILVTLLVDVNLGIVYTLITSTLAGLFYDDISLVAYFIAGSLVGIYSIRQYKDRAVILKSGITIGVVCAFALLGIGLLRQDPAVFSSPGTRFGLALLSGMLSAGLVSVFLPVLESLFKITTDIRLLELSNLNAPILRRLSVEAPGTYHHSLMVGTLGEAAAEAIGANPLLVRVAAYYHDVGKILKPDYYVENQLYGANKHEDLSPSMSCLILASHVKEGLELAKGIGLAQQLRDMIPQHHGTRIMTYFYRKAKDSADPKSQEIAEADFRYPGPKPQSKEAAIVMMADSVEAASRTLSDPSGAQIQGMINRLVDAIVDDNQFDESDITFSHIKLVKESFLKILTGIFHRRIDYPGYDFKNAGGESEGASVQDSGSEQAKAV